MGEIDIIGLSNSIPFVLIFSWIIALFWIVFSFAITYHWVVYTRNIVATILALSIYYGVSLALIGLIVTNL